MTHLTQIFISDDDNQKLSNILEYSTGTVKECYPECEYTLYNNEMLRNFIYQYFDSEVLNAYDGIKAYAGKADLGRYCVAYINGGWYADITIKMVSRLDSYLNWDIICFYDGGGMNDMYSYQWGLQNALFYTKPKNIIFEKSIETVVKNYKNKFYGMSPISATATGVFGISYAKYGHTLEKRTQGVFKHLTPQCKWKNASYILDDGWIIAQHKCAWHSQNIFDFGVSGVNNYVDLWWNRNFYGEKDD